MNGKVIVVGASNKPDRYSHRALVLCKEMGYDVVPVHPVVETIEGLAVVRRCDEIRDEVHTVTLYVNPWLVLMVTEHVLKAKPKRVIFNPGTETEEAERLFTAAGIRCVRACTIVLLTTGQFDTA